MLSCFVAADAASVGIPIHAVSAANANAQINAAENPAAVWLKAHGFAGKAGECVVVPTAEGGIASVYFGVGSDDAAGRLLPGKLPSLLPAGIYQLGDGWSDPAGAALTFALGAYRFTRYKASKREAPRLVLPAGADFVDADRIAAGVWLARDLINAGPNDMGPAELAGAAEALAKEHGAAISIIAGDELEAGFPLIHAVGVAATPERAPRLIDLRWGEESGPRITIVGKGVCFDTGGLDIKPSSAMLLMKKDMGGAANALGLAHMIMSARLPVRLRVLIPAVENAIAGAAFRPGDVLTARDGTTVEIGNTDAEGRLVLADALTLAAEENPALVIDLATLTGAARVALGPEIIPVYTRDDVLAEDLTRHSMAVRDPVWRMPLWTPYQAMIDSKIADINNSGQGGFAGSITAALFLARFVPDTIPWLHADIYGWTPSTKPGKPEGGEAQAVRALYEVLKERYPA